MRRDAEGLASPTLAQLYLEQGHPDRARAVCKEVLAAEPTNGYALALHERLRRGVSARIEASFVSSSDVVDLGVGEIELAWMVPRILLEPYPDARLDVVVAIAAHDSLAPGPLALRYTSIRCLDLKATRRLDVPLGPASAAVALTLSAGPVRSRLTVEQRRRELRILAVAEPLSW